jgi:hypothetical protein
MSTFIASQLFLTYRGRSAATQWQAATAAELGGAPPSAPLHDHCPVGQLAYLHGQHGLPDAGQLMQTLRA